MQKVVKKFIETYLICRYGSLEKIINDNAQTFTGKIIIELGAKWKSSIPIPRRIE